MNILFVAPNMTDINAIPEIRAITSTHKAHVLNGQVSLQDVYQAVMNNEYDAIHIVAHMTADTSTLDEIVLSGAHVLDLQAAARVAKLANAKLVVFSSCLASRFATYLTKHGVPCVIFTTVEIADSTAWELPNSFYEQCKRAERKGRLVDYRAVFNSVDSGDGTYGILISDAYYTDMLQPINEALGALTKRVDDLYKILEEQGYPMPYIPTQRRRIVTAIIVAIVAVFFVASIITIISSLVQIL